MAARLVAHRRARFALAAARQRLDAVDALHAYLKTDDARMAERVVLCEATGVVMRACFDLLGIEYLMQI